MTRSSASGCLATASAPLPPRRRPSRRQPRLLRSARSGRRRRPGPRAVDDDDADRRRQRHPAADRRAHRGRLPDRPGRRARARTTPTRCPRSRRKSQIPVIADIHFQPQVRLRRDRRRLRRRPRQPGQHQDSSTTRSGRSPRPRSDAGTPDPDRRQRRLAGQAAAGEVRQGHARGAGRVGAVGVLAVRGARLPRHQDLGQAQRPGRDGRAPTGCSPSSATTRCTSASPRPGPAFQGTIKSAVAFGALLAEGIGDTIRVSLSAPPVEEVKVGNADPRVAQPAPARPGDRVLPVLRPRPGRRLHARRAGHRRARGPGGAAAGRGHGLRRQRARARPARPTSASRPATARARSSSRARSSRPCPSRRSSRRSSRRPCGWPRRWARTPRATSPSGDAGGQRLLARHAPAGRAVRTRDRAGWVRDGARPPARCACWHRDDLAAPWSLLDRDPVGHVLRRHPGWTPRASTRGASAARCGAGSSRRPSSRRSATPAPTSCRCEADAGGASRAFADRARRIGRRCSSIVGPADDGRSRCGRCSSRPGDRPARSASHQPLLAIDGRPARRRRPAGAAGPHDRARPADAGLPSRCSPRRSASRRWPAAARRVPRPGRRAGARRPGVRPDRGRPGGLQGRDRRGGPRRPARSRASGWRPSSAAGGWPRPAWPRSSQHARRDSRRWSASTSTTSTPPARAAYTRVGFREVGSFATVLF